MKDGKNDFHCRKTCFLLNTDRNAASVVGDGDDVVLLYIDGDKVAVAGKSLVYGVVHNLIDKVVKTLGSGRADIHARTLSDGFQSLQYLYLIFVISLGVHSRADRFNIKLVFLHILQSTILRILCKLTSSDPAEKAGFTRWIHIKTV